MTTYVALDKNLLAAGEPSIRVLKDDRATGELLGIFSTVEVYGPSRLVTYDKVSVWLLTEADWKGT